MEIALAFSLGIIIFGIFSQKLSEIFTYKEPKKGKWK